MNSKVALAALVACLFVAVFAAMSEKNEGQAPAGAAMEMPMSTEGMMPSPMEMMKQMGMPDAMMTRCRLMMAAQMDLNDPAALLALKDELKLTDDQVAKLKAILQKAREEATAILTEEQNKALEAVPKTPDTMMAMCKDMMQRMMPMMQKMMSGKGATQPMMMCPMCPMMRTMGGMGMGPSGGGRESDKGQAPPSR